MGCRIVEAKNVDLREYDGKWYEVASLPAWFQRGCENTTAEYTIKDDYVEVLNTCEKGGKIKERKGKAFETTKENVLKVQFFPLIKSDYIIEFVDQNYNYAIVGSSNKRYLWILSRHSCIDYEDINYLVKIAKEKGYDVSRLNFQNLDECVLVEIVVGEEELCIYF